MSDRTAAIADDLILSSRCPIVESMRYQGSAGYAPGSDRILIAPRETFLSDETFTRVLLHRDDPFDRTPLRPQSRMQH